MTITVGNISSCDWHEIMRIEKEAYEEISPETQDALKSKVDLSPDTCFIATNTQNETCGYLIAHPYILGKPVPFNEVHTTLPNESDCIYIHDLAISKNHRGQGIAPTLLNTLWTNLLPKGITHISLVAVQNAHAFWQKMGVSISSQLLSTDIGQDYGANATYMTAHLAALLNE